MGWSEGKRDPWVPCEFSGLCSVKFAPFFSHAIEVATGFRLVQVFSYGLLWILHFGYGAKIGNPNPMACHHWQSPGCSPFFLTWDPEPPPKQCVDGLWSFLNPTRIHSRFQCPEPEETPSTQESLQPSQISFNALASGRVTQPGRRIDSDRSRVRGSNSNGRNIMLLNFVAFFFFFRRFDVSMAIDDLSTTLDRCCRSLLGCSWRKKASPKERQTHDMAVLSQENLF